MKYIHIVTSVHISIKSNTPKSNKLETTSPHPATCSLTFWSFFKVFKKLQIVSKWPTRSQFWGNFSVTMKTLMRPKCPGPQFIMVKPGLFLRQVLLKVKWNTKMMENLMNMSEKRYSENQLSTSTQHQQKDDNYSSKSQIFKTEINLLSLQPHQQ